MTKKNITIIGAGAVGLELGVRSAASGTANITFVAKEGSERLRALVTKGGKVTAHPRDSMGHISLPPEAFSVTHDIHTITEPQDYVIVAIKAYDLTEEFVHRTLQPLIDKNSNIKVVLAQNGIPVWFNHKVDGLHGVPINAIDPTGRILEAIGPDRILGMVLSRVTNYMNEPGVVENCSPPPYDANGTPIARLIIGKPSGRGSQSAQTLTDIFNQSGMTTDNATPTFDRPKMLHFATLYKLMLNIVGALCVVTGKPLGVTLSDPMAQKVAELAINEARHITSYYKITTPLPGTKEFLSIAGSLTDYRPSILNDLEQGRPLEINAILRAVSSIRAHYSLPSPVLDELADHSKRLEDSVRALGADERSALLINKWSTETPDMFRRAVISATSLEPSIIMPPRVPKMKAHHQTPYTTALIPSNKSEDDLVNHMRIGLALLMLEKNPQAAKLLRLGSTSKKSITPPNEELPSDSDDEASYGTSAPIPIPPQKTSASRTDTPPTVSGSPESPDGSLSDASDTDNIVRPDFSKLTLRIESASISNTAHIYWKALPPDAALSAHDGRKIAEFLAEELAVLTAETIDKQKTTAPAVGGDPSNREKGITIIPVSRKHRDHLTIIIPSKTHSPSHSSEVLTIAEALAERVLGRPLATTPPSRDR